MKCSTVIAVDVAKSVFEIAVSRHPGRISERHRISRERLPELFAQRLPATVLMEACSSAHDWARCLVELGHDVALLPPRLVRPYRTGNKNDRADAKALLEAYRNEDIHPLPLETVEQHTIIALLRLRRRLGRNNAATVVANKLDRIAWAVWKRQTPFRSVPLAA